ncbi:MAG: hypothetical protein K6D03_10990 [Solobacterium sp.]|nr:hypothetical protein [Solobacterium sp.]
MGILMILVTLGTQDKQFPRLLKAVEKAVKEKYISDRVVVQAGHTKYESACMEIFDFIPNDQFASFLQEADLIITHGGVGTIMTALREHKKILAAARSVKYGEHQSDHQIQLLEEFDADGYLIFMRDLDDIHPYLEKAVSFVPKSYESNTASMISLIEDWISSHPTRG